MPPTGKKVMVDKTTLSAREGTGIMKSAIAALNHRISAGLKDPWWVLVLRLLLGGIFMASALSKLP
jgi:hypothetical protein